MNASHLTIRFAVIATVCFESWQALPAGGQCHWYDLTKELRTGGRALCGRESAKPQYDFLRWFRSLREL
ncbi:MAG: hypothetical protein ACREOO_27595 [bacterium]